MQVVRSLEHHDVSLVGYGIRVLLIADEGSGAGLQRQLAGLGGVVEQKNEVFEGLEALIDDPYDYGLCVIDCALAGGIDAGRRAVQMLSVASRRVPVILVSTECKGQEFPLEQHAPVVLRAPASSVSLRVGFEHALRDRLANRLI